MTELVVISLERWDDVWRRNQHLVAGLLDADPELRVLFVEPPADPTHDLRSGRRPRFGARLREVPGVAPGRLHAVRPVKWMPRRIDRREYGLEWNMALDSGGWLVSEKITLEFELSAIKRSEDATKAA